MSAKSQKTNTNTAREESAPKTAKTSKKIERQQKIAAACKEMAPLAREVNAKMRSVQRMEGKIDDARLAACVALAKAFAIAKDNGVPFKPWCEKHIKAVGYESARKMRPIGEAEIAEEGAGLAMLQAAREKNASANRKHRASKSSESKSESEDAGDEGGASVPRPQDRMETMRQLFLALTPDEQIDFVDWAQRKVGLAA